MKNFILKRVYFDDATLGMLWNNKEPESKVLFTIERPWLQNKKDISCIPEGKYKVVKYSSKKFPDVWQLEDVKDRTLILIHKANFASQLKGCIALGTSVGYMSDDDITRKAVKSSGVAFELLDSIVGDDEGFNLRITS